MRRTLIADDASPRCWRLGAHGGGDGARLRLRRDRLADPDPRRRAPDHRPGDRHRRSPGDSPGDQLPFANPIFDASNTHQVGSDEGNCVRASVDQGRWECMWTTFLRKGQITVEGPFRDAFPTTVLAVTGGTGAYAQRARADGAAHAQGRQLRLHLQAPALAPQADGAARPTVACTVDGGGTANGGGRAVSVPWIRAMAAVAAFACMLAAPVGDRDGGRAGGARGADHRDRAREQDVPDIVGNSNAPYIQSLIAAGTLYTNYQAAPGSLPDYLRMTGGIATTSAAKNSDNIFDQLADGRTSAGAQYNESMPSACYTKSGPAAVRQEPQRGRLVQRHHVEQGRLRQHAALHGVRSRPTCARSPTSSRTTTNDMHDGSSKTAQIKAGDTWLEAHVPAMLAGGAEVIVTWDEGTRSNEHIATIAIGGSGQEGRDGRHRLHALRPAGRPRGRLRAAAPERRADGDAAPDQLAGDRGQSPPSAGTVPGVSRG